MIYFFDDKSNEAKKVIVQVKSGHAGVRDVRDLKGTMEREGAAIAALITLREPTEPMKRESLAAGFYEPEWSSAKYQRLQILTVEDLLAGKKLAYPRRRVETFNKAERKHKKPLPTQGLLL